MNEIDELERLLLKLINLEGHTCLTLYFNQEAYNYMKVKDYGEDEERFAEWISEQEKQNGQDTNRCWTLQWYPSTPNGFEAVRASSLSAIISYVKKITSSTS